MRRRVFEHPESGFCRRLSVQYRKWQRYILHERLAYEMRLLAEDFMNGGGSCTDPYNNRPAIWRGAGVVEVDRTDLVPGSAL